MPDIFIRRENNAGRITFTRPTALNALTHDMALQIEAALLSWRIDDDIKLVIIDSEGQKAFCAGGDIQALYDYGMRGDFAFGRRFWRDEYRLNALIANYPKPYIAMMDGIVMGGGVGISMHGSHRIVTENTIFAMPECSIGLIPDVGGSLLLAKMPGFLGEFAGLTGARFKANDCLYAGLADYKINSSQRDDLVKELAHSGDINIITQYQQPWLTSQFEQHKTWIDDIFSRTSLKDIIIAIDTEIPSHLQKPIQALSKGAPLSFVWSFNLIRNARRHKNLKQTLLEEYRAVSIASSHGEFLEGIRAAIINKDHCPDWRYKTIDDIPGDLINKIYEAAIDGDINWRETS